MEYGMDQSIGSQLGNPQRASANAKSLVGAQLSQPTTLRNVLSILIERTEKLAALSGEVADSISGPTPTAQSDQAIESGPGNLRSMINMVRNNIDRAEQEVLRAHNHL